MKATQRKPIAVLISDIHFTPATLELASSALRQAIQRATELSVPVVLAGDTLDSKAIIRGECANRILEILSEPGPEKIILVGNHDLLNEKGKAHSLNFLRPYCDVIEHPVFNEQLDSWLVPYQNSLGELQVLLNSIKPGSRLIMHQGVHGAAMGHYVQDKTSLPAEAFADFRVISGHYHKAQDIKCGRPRKGAVGLFSYIGTPYTTSFAEAHDGPKGFQVLYDDGTMELMPTNLRKHVVWESTVGEFEEACSYGSQFQPEDLVWIKLKGPHDILQKLKKSDISKLLCRPNFKLDKIYTDTCKLESKAESMTDAQVMDAVIEATDDSPEHKANLKQLWREVLS